MSHTLSTPLLNNNNNNNNNNIKININIEEPTIQNPYKFLGINNDNNNKSLLSTIDPFRNSSDKISGLYEWVKIITCIPIALIRLIIFGLSLLLGYISTKIALFKWKDRHNPMPTWRSKIMFITRISTRFILFSFGYQWIKRKGRPASRETAPIVVSNHVSYIDPIFFFYELFPSIVASDSHDSIPFVGTIIRAMQVIYVNRFLPDSRKNAIYEIKRKAACNRFPRVLLFPEGTTTNGRSLLSFQMGAFIPGYPIQPVIVRYPHVHFDQSWGNISLGKLMFRMFTQFHNFMEVEYLPVVTPLWNHKEDVSNFAQRTANAMASALNVVQTSYGYGDMLLLAKAVEMNHENPSRFMAELAHPDLASHINTTEALEFLEKFLSMNPDKSGCVNIDDFLAVLRLKRCGLSEKIFAFVDFEMNGKINFKQFLLASTRVMKQPLFQHACEYAFAKCCNDGYDFVSKEQFGDAIREVIPYTNDNDFAMMSFEQNRRVLKTIAKSKTWVGVLFDMLDMDGDGRVEKHDFLTFLRKNPLLIALFFPLQQDEFSHTSNGLVELEEIIC